MSTFCLIIRANIQQKSKSNLLVLDTKWDQYSRKIDINKSATKLKYTEPQPGIEPGSLTLPGKCATPKPMAQTHNSIAASPP